MDTELQAEGLKRILVVEDDFSLRAMLSRFLESLRYEVFTAEDGSIGLEKATQLRPDLILTDLNLPFMSGLEMSAKIKSDPRLKDIPILMMTGDLTAMKDKLKGFGNGADDYIVKPVDIAVLAAKIKMILRG